MDYLQEQNGIDIHSLLIIRNGYVVTDAYFYPFAPGYLHDLASATKSFTSSLIGIAIDKGAIESVEQPVLDFFQERTVANLDENKEAMMLEDLLTMRSGFKCINQPTEVTLSEMMASPDWSQFALDLPMTAEPGRGYFYCSPNSHLLSAIIQETTGMSALAFAQEHLFGPLGISDVVWPADPQGNNWGWGDLKLAPHDMAKLGYLFLNEGLWDGQQVVSPAWVEAATTGASYGYQWWLKPRGIYFATGVGGQEIWVLPDRDLVVVMTGATGGGGSGAWGDRLMNSRIIPLLDSTEPLPANPDGEAALESRIQDAAAAVQVQPEPVPPMPEIARQVADQTFVLDANPVGVQSMSLDFPEEAEAVLGLSFVDGNQIEWLIGLDDVLRYFPGSDGLRAGAKGWWESGNVFVIDRQDIGGYARERISAAFEEDQVTIQIQDLNRPDAVLTLAGRLEE
jgi:CubicO group peptidase (beta-lactamase class C family)